MTAFAPEVVTEELERERERERERKGKGKGGGHLGPTPRLDCLPLLGRTYASEQLDPWEVESRYVGSPADRNVLRGDF